MQIGIISDLHANPFALESAIEHFKSKMLKKFFVLGILWDTARLSMRRLRL